MDARRWSILMLVVGALMLAAAGIASAAIVAYSQAAAMAGG